MQPRQVVLGEVAVGVEVPFEVRIANHGELPVTLGGLDADCSCTQMRLERSVFGPGEQTTIHSVFRAGVMPGDKHSRVKLLVLKPFVRVISIPISATVQRKLTVDPSTLVLAGEFAASRKVGGRFRLHNASDMRVRVLGVEGLPPSFVANATPADVEPGAVGELTLSTEADYLVAEEWSATLRTTLPFEETIPFRVRIEPSDGLKLSPRVLQLGLLNRSPPTSFKEYRLQVRGHRLGELALIGLDVPDFLELASSYDRNTGSAGHDLRFRLRTSGLTQRTLDGTVQLRLRRMSDQRDYVLSVPVLGLVTDGD